MRKFIIPSKLKFLVILVVSLLSVSSTFAKTSNFHVKIGAGSLTGIYFPTGSALCKILNSTRESKNMKCSALTTQGSVYNLNSLIQNKMSFALTESQTLKEAYNITGEFSNLKFANLRAVFALHEETYVILVRKDNLINSIKDLEGKKINIGQEGSGARKAFSNILKIYNLEYNDFSKVTEYNTYQQSDELCKGNIDVAMYVVGHPSGALEEALNLCETKILAVEGDKINSFVKGNNQFTHMNIPAQIYSKGQNEIPTIGIRSILATSSQVDKQLVYNLTKELFTSLDEFKDFHPAFADLKRETMIEGASVIPLHEGALEYYREIGLE